jgi:hypothetical protein
MLRANEFVIAYKLEKISDVNDKGARDRRNINPALVMDNLKPSDIVLKKNGDKREIGVLAYA